VSVNTAPSSVNCDWTCWRCYWARLGSEANSGVAGPTFGAPDGINGVCLVAGCPAHSSTVHETCDCAGASAVNFSDHGRPRPSELAGWSHTSTSAVISDDMCAVAASEFQPPLDEACSSNHLPLRVSAPYCTYREENHAAYSHFGVYSSATRSSTLEQSASI